MPKMQLRKPSSSRGSTPHATPFSEKRFTFLIGAIAAAATVAQAIFAYMQYNFSAASFEKQLRLTEKAGDDNGKQVDRLIATAERLAKSGEESTANSERAVRDTLQQGKLALAQSAEANQKTARLVRDAQEVFAAQAFPVVKATAYQFQVAIGSTENTCSTPPIGVGIIYTNQSAIPVLTKSVKLRLSVAGRDIFPELASKPPLTEERIMATKDVGMVSQTGRAFMNAFAARISQEAPPIRGHLTVVYEALPTKRCYRYTGVVDVLGICTLPDQYEINPHDEEVKTVPCEPSKK